MSTNSMTMSQVPGGIHIERFRLHIERMIRFSLSNNEDADARAADAFNLARQHAWRASEQGSHDALIEIIEREL